VTKIPATLYGETVYIVWIDSRNPPTAAFIRADGHFGWSSLSDFTVLSWEAEDVPGSWVPKAPKCARPIQSS
jgi:hypothetical protein